MSAPRKPAAAAGPLAMTADIKSSCWLDVGAVPGVAEGPPTAMLLLAAAGVVMEGGAGGGSSRAMVHCWVLKVDLW